MSIIEKINKISATMDALFDFVAQDDFIAADFEKFLEHNKVELKTQAQLTKVIMFYVLECHLSSGERVIDKFKTSDKAVLKAFRENYKSVFEVRKIQKNSFETYCLTNEREMTLIALAKTTELRGIGLRDYILGRIIELDGEFFILEIDDVIPSSSKNAAQIEGVKFLVRNPEKIHFHNPEKLAEFKEITGVMCPSFRKCMGLKKGENKVITTNKLADDLLEYFNSYHHNLLKEGDALEPLIATVEEFGWFDVAEYRSDETINDAFFANAAGGFSNHNCVYDVGFWVDDELGIFIIPFLGTFFAIFEAKNEAQREKIKGWKDCVCEFFKSSKVPPGVLYEAQKKCAKFNEIAALALGEENGAADIDLIEKYKKEYFETTKFSPTIVLYNSELFVKVLGIVEEAAARDEVGASDASAGSIGRNDPCPCGSGKKYKKCCLK